MRMVRLVLRANRILLSGVLVLLATTRAGIAAADLGTPASFDIPPQALNTAVLQFTEQSGVQITSAAELLRGRRSAGVSGTFPASEALTRILAGTKLSYEVVDSNTAVIRAPTQPAAKVSAAAPENVDERGEAQQQSFWDRFRLAQSAPEAARANTAVEDQAAAADAPSRMQLQEIVVTATKRAENLQEVPISISVVSAEEIGRRGLVSAEDYLRGIPGVSQTSQSYGESIVIRGIESSSSAQNFASGPTVATYFGETPTTNTAGLAGGANVDIKLVDIDRVEVLRGPQGTAFGTSSMGGAVRTIPTAPKLDGASARVIAGYASTSGTGGNNYNVQLIGNLPLIEDRLAVRAVGYDFRESGFYRNVAGSSAAFQPVVTQYGAEAFAADQREVGDSHFKGGRLSALFRATDDLKVTVSYLSQKTEVDGKPLANAGTYEQTFFEVAPEHTFRGQRGGLFDTDIDLANAVLEYDLGWGDLLATYSHTRSGGTWVAPGFLNVPPFPGSQRGTGDHREDIGEIRVSTRFEGPWNLLAGLYAEKLDDEYLEDFYWNGTLASNPFGLTERFWYDYRDSRDLKQKAAFAEVSWELVPRVTLTGGIRAYDYERSGQVIFSGPTFGETVTDVASDASGTSFRGNLSYKPSADTLLYAGWSQGFRLGKPQPGLPGICDRDSDGIIDGTAGVSLESTRRVNSDNVNNSEIGAKFALLERRLSVAADLYRMDWNGLPANSIAPAQPQGCGFTYLANAGKARSEGIELQASFQATRALRLDVGGSLIDATLVEDVPAQGWSDGDRLPGAPKVNANFGVQYELGFGSSSIFLRADSIYVGKFRSNLTEPEALNGGYVKLDASARVARGPLSIDLFVRNLTNEDDFTFGAYTDGSGQLVGYRPRPRTIGVQVGYDF